MDLTDYYVRVTIEKDIILLLTIKKEFQSENKNIFEFGYVVVVCWLGGCRCFCVRRESSHGANRASIRHKQSVFVCFDDS